VTLHAQKQGPPLVPSKLTTSQNNYWLYMSPNVKRSPFFAGILNVGHFRSYSTFHNVMSGRHSVAPKRSSHKRGYALPGKRFQLPTDRDLSLTYSNRSTRRPVRRADR